MQVAGNVATVYCGVMVKFLGLAAYIVNLKVGGSTPLLGNTSTMDVFHYTPQLHGILQHFFLPRDGSHLSAERQNSECQIFYFLTFSAEGKVLAFPTNTQMDPES